MASSKVFESVLEGKAAPIPFEQIYNTSLAAFKALESIKTGQVITF
jgi:hypothetical protein